MIWLKRILIVFGTVIITYILAVTFFFFSPTISDYFNRTDFDSQIWIEWQETEATLKTRWNMVHDLTENHELIGKNVTDLKNMLGEPSSESKHEIRYYLGMTGFGIDTGSLAFTIKDGIVTDFKVWQG